jgi:hypothetical protein
MAFKQDIFGKVNAMANISDQTTKQRNQFAGEEGILGANRGAFNLFDIEQRGTAEEINAAAYNKLVELYIENAYIDGDNPDFGVNSLKAKQLGYDAFPSTDDIVTSHESLSDKPNTFGPNINTHGFNDDGTPNLNDQQISSPTFEGEGKQGFGSSFGRNELDNNTFGSYLRRKKVNVPADQEPKLGEYVDIDGYSLDDESEEN